MFKTAFKFCAPLLQTRSPVVNPAFVGTKLCQCIVSGNPPTRPIAKDKSVTEPSGILKVTEPGAQNVVGPAATMFAGTTLTDTSTEVREALSHPAMVCEAK